MIEFTWTGTVAEARLWARELQQFSVAGLTAGTLRERLSNLDPVTLTSAVFPTGTTDHDLISQVLRARPDEALLVEILAEAEADAAGLTASLEFTEPGRVVEWDRAQPLIGLPAHVRRAGRMVDTVGFIADCLDTRQGEWDMVRPGWLARMAQRGWAPASVTFLSAAFNGFLIEYERQAAPQMGQALEVEPLSDHPRIREAVRELPR